MLCIPAAAWATYGGSAQHARAYCGHQFDGALTQRYVKPVAGLMEFPPTYRNGIAYEATDSGTVVAFHASDGTNVWRISLTGVIADSPTVVHGRVFVQTRASGLYALSAGTGKLLWRKTGWLGESTPTAFGNWICTATLSGTAGCFGQYGGRLKWQDSLGCKVTGSITRGGALLYLADYCGNVWKLGAYHGRTIWRRHLGGAIYANTALADGRLFVADRDSGKLVALDTASGANLWATAVGPQLYTSPAVSGGGVYAASRGGSMVKLDEATGAVRWRSQAAGLVMGSPVVVGGQVFFSVMGAHYSPGQILGYSTSGMHRTFTFSADGRYSPCTPAGDVLLLVGQTHIYALS